MDADEIAKSDKPPRLRYVFRPYEHGRLWSDAAETGSPPSSMSSPVSSEAETLGPQQPSEASRHKSFLQLLLPDVAHIWKLVDYHETHLLWYHCCYHGPTFRAELETVIAEQGGGATLAVERLSLRWLALLFSVMAGALTCSPDWRLSGWGFSKPEAAELSRQWYQATITSLNHDRWTSDHDIYSIQAIATLTMSAHPLGRSLELSALLCTALRIAQSLGLHRLDHVAALDEIDENSSDEQRHRSTIRELGRKLWSQLCVQDWMSLPSAGAHSINPSHFTTTKPSSKDHLTMNAIPATFPTYISYGNYLFDIAKLVVLHNEAMMQSTTAYTSYQNVLDYDTRMRNLATKGMPRYFHVLEPVDDSWPEWVHWARSSLTICFSHKIIMIHRAYIRRSFTDPLFSKTRVTCTAAAKTILNEARQAREVDGPIIWVDKAYCIAAAVILCLDIFHRSDSDAEFPVHRNLVLHCIEQLQGLGDSTISERGLRLLSEILARRDRPDFSPGWPPEGLDVSGICGKPDSMGDAYTRSLGVESDLLAELFPPQMGFSDRLIR